MYGLNKLDWRSRMAPKEEPLTQVVMNKHGFLKVK